MMSSGNAVNCELNDNTGRQQRDLWAGHGMGLCTVKLEEQWRREHGLWRVFHGGEDGGSS
jgi:hypothetical protein